RMKGWALGLNAAGGNIGVSGVQLLTPLLMGFGFVSLYQATPMAGGLYLQNAGLMWLLPLTIPVIGPLLFMNDLTGGAIVTFWNFIAMGAATIGVMYFVDIKGFAGFLTMFLILFVTTGIGNGSTYRMIPAIFREEKRRETKGLGDVARAAALKAAG